MTAAEDASRRDFLETGLAAASTGLVASGVAQAPEHPQPSGLPPEKVRYAE